MISLDKIFSCIIDDTHQFQQSDKKCKWLKCAYIEAMALVTLTTKKILCEKKYFELNLPEDKFNIKIDGTIYNDEEILNIDVKAGKYNIDIKSQGCVFDKTYLCMENKVYSSKIFDTKNELKQITFSSIKNSIILHSVNTVTEQKILDNFYSTIHRLHESFQQINKYTNKSDDISYFYLKLVDSFNQTNKKLKEEEKQRSLNGVIQ